MSFIITDWTYVSFPKRAKKKSCSEIDEPEKKICLLVRGLSDHRDPPLFVFETLKSTEAN